MVGGLPGFHRLVGGLTVVSVEPAESPGDATITDEGVQGTGPPGSTAGRITALQGLASIGAGAIDAAAVGIHAEHPTLSRLFVAVAAAQILTGLATLAR